MADGLPSHSWLRLYNLPFVEPPHLAPTSKQVRKSAPLPPVRAKAHCFPKPPKPPAAYSVPRGSLKIDTKESGCQFLCPAAEAGRHSRDEQGLVSRSSKRRIKICGNTAARAVRAEPAVRPWAAGSERLASSVHNPARLARQCGSGSASRASIS